VTFDGQRAANQLTSSIRSFRPQGLTRRPRRQSRGDFRRKPLAVDAEIDRTYVSRLERGLENPSVAVLERLAKALSANIEELFKVPRAGEAAPRPLKGGRKPKG
jgi:transcriptional regulator with XRE-family HTH domain